MTVISKAATGTDITLTGGTPVVGAVNKPASAASTAYAVCNADTTIAFIRFGTSVSVTAAATDIPLPPGQLVFIDPGAGITHAAAVSGGAGTGHVYICPVYLQGRF